MWSFIARLPGQVERIIIFTIHCKKLRKRVRVSASGGQQLQKQRVPFLGADAVPAKDRGYNLIEYLRVAGIELEFEVDVA